jgi:hypothetical protein
MRWSNLDLAEKEVMGGEAGVFSWIELVASSVGDGKCHLPQHRPGSFRPSRKLKRLALRLVLILD